MSIIAQPIGLIEKEKKSTVAYAKPLTSPQYSVIDANPSFLILHLVSSSFLIISGASHAMAIKASGGICAYSKACQSYMLS